MNSERFMKSTFHLFLVLTIVILPSCDYCKLWGVTTMGNGFSIVESDKDHVAIDYCTSKCCDSGIPIVPSNITEYNYDSKWIIAKSVNVTSNTYWIVDKNFDIKLEYDNNMEKQILKHVLGPLDSADFYKKVNYNKIDLTLKKYKSLQ